MLSLESVPIATVIYQTRTNYTNAVKSRIISTDEGFDYIDWRQVRFVAGGSGGATVADHGALAGLGDDDHAQYLLLAGRSVGQIAYGGTDASDTLTLEGTSNATKGYVNINPSGGYVGIGTATPGCSLDIRGTTANLNINSTTTTNSVYARFENVGGGGAVYVGRGNSTSA